MRYVGINWIMVEYNEIQNKKDVSKIEQYGHNINEN